MINYKYIASVQINNNKSVSRINCVQNFKNFSVISAVCESSCLYIWCCDDVWYLWCVCVFLVGGELCICICICICCCDEVWYLWCVFLGRGRLCSKRWLDCPSWPSANVINDKLILYYHVSGGWYIFLSPILLTISPDEICVAH